VLVVAGAAAPQPEQAEDGEVLAWVTRYRAEGISMSEACRRAAAQAGRKKSEVYRLALEQED
jgi:16S rRNA C1402 (ribose-2'-O) methylase RsmI